MNISYEYTQSSIKRKKNETICVLVVGKIICLFVFNGKYRRQN